MLGESNNIGVIFFEAPDFDELDKKLNGWLKDVNVGIHDIRYDHKLVITSDDVPYDIVSAMIIYNH